MAFLTVPHIAFKGVAACVPKTIEENAESAVFASVEDAAKFIASTGVERRRISDPHTTTSDLCYAAAARLLDELGWSREEVDCLVFVTQTPDYILPATSCILQDRLGLSTECYTLDISLGCSGWVYGLSVLSSLMAGGTMKRGLLLAGETSTKVSSSTDKSVWPLFGDGGSATALEFDRTADSIEFQMSSNGSGSEAIIIPQGGFRNPATPHSFEKTVVEEGIERTGLDLTLNGMDVFSFGISKAPQSVNKLLDRLTWNKEQVDYFLFHQANLFMNEKIRKKLALTPEQVPYSLGDFGNTSSTSIPLTLVSQLRGALRGERLRLVGCGFGVGLSWGSVGFTTDKICVPELIEL